MAGRNIVICCDGTGNEVDHNLSNVLKLFRVSVRNDGQAVYYNAGIGTIGTSDAWTRLRQKALAIFGLLTGYGLDREILGAYDFICRNYRSGDDRIFLFGFSRGAYTVRAVAGLIHMIGLLPVNQLNLAGYALRAYKRASDDDDFTIAWQFAKVTGARRATIRFIGVWDTVASVMVPRGDRILPRFLTLPHTRRNPSVEIFRHAMAIDERRRMFRLNRWQEPQPFVANPFDTNAPRVAQDIRQVWFAGVHSDIGGGYPEAESGPAKYPLDWLVREAVAAGLKVNPASVNYIVRGKPRLGGRNEFVKPSATAPLHDSMSFGWRLLEWLPKPARHREWPPGASRKGYYLPQGEPRRIDDGLSPARIHVSVTERIAATGYAPPNLPGTYTTET